MLLGMAGPDCLGLVVWDVHFCKALQAVLKSSAELRGLCVRLHGPLLFMRMQRD